MWSSRTPEFEIGNGNGNGRGETGVVENPDPPPPLLPPPPLPPPVPPRLVLDPQLRMGHRPPQQALLLKQSCCPGSVGGDGSCAAASGTRGPEVGRNELGLPRPRNEIHPGSGGW